MTQFLLVRSKQGLGLDRVGAAQRSNERGCCKIASLQIGQNVEIIDGCLFCFMRQFLFSGTGRTADLNRAAAKGEHRQSCRVPQPVSTEPFKSFSALDNHPLFAVY